MSFHVAGLGTAVPTHTMNQAEGLELARAVLRPDTAKARLLKPLYRRAGVNNRHTCVPYQVGMEWANLPTAPQLEGESVSRGAATGVRMQLYEEHAAPLALAAARSALEQGKIDPASISHVVTVSCTGFSAPGVDAALIQQLQLRPDTERVHVGFMGCHGAINGLRVVTGLSALESSSCVLLCAVELCSLHYFFAWIPDKLVSNALFADGAAAIVGSARRQESCWQVVATGSYVFPETTEAMTWRLGDYGFEMSLSSSVPDLIATSLRPWLVAWLDRQGLGLHEIAHWAIHPGGPRIVSAVAKALELTSAATETSLAILAEYGNMSSPTVLFIIERLQQQGASGPCLVVAFGPGLVAELALVHL